MNLFVNPVRKSIQIQIPVSPNLGVRLQSELSNGADPVKSIANFLMRLVDFSWNSAPSQKSQKQRKKLRKYQVFLSKSDFRLIFGQYQIGPESFNIIPYFVYEKRTQG